MADLEVTAEVRTRGVTAGLLDYFILGVRAVRFIFVRPFYWRDTLIQMDRIGVDSIPIVMLTGIFSGMVLALQSSIELKRFGAEVFIGNLVAASMVRELGPVMAALMVAGRAASGIAAEIGSMRVTEQIEALQSFGTDPIKKLVTPRLIAIVITLPMLTMITDVIGVIGGMAIAVTRVGVTADVYMQGVLRTLAESGFALVFVPKDLIAGLTKPIVFGTIIAITACYFGLRTRGGTEGVGLAATRAVVTSSVLILATDYFLSQLLLIVLYATP